MFLSMSFSGLHVHSCFSKIHHFQSPQLQQATLRHDVPQRLSQIEKEVYAKTKTAEYEQYWSSRIQKIMQRIQSMPPTASPGMQQQPAPSTSPGMQPEHHHSSHMQHSASPYAQMSSGQPVPMSTYRHPYESAGHGGATGAHANAYSQQTAARYSTMGTQGHQMHGHGDTTSYYPNMMYSNDQRSSMPDMMQAQQQHMQSQGGYRVNDSPYTNGGYAMMPNTHAPGDSQQRHGAVLANTQQQQRMSAAGSATDSPYANMRHPHTQQQQQQQQQAGSYAMKNGPMGTGTDPSQHGGYNTSSPSHAAAGNGMASAGAKRMSSMMPSFNAPGALPGMQPHMADMSVPQQMQATHASHAQLPSQPNMMSQCAAGAQGAGGMGAQGRGSAAGNNVPRSARESFADGLPNFEPTPIDQIGLSADDDDFSDIADIIGGKPPGGTEGGQEMPQQGHGPELASDPYAANAQLTPGGQNHGQMVSPRQWNPSIELMPQSMSSPYASPAAMPQQQHMQMQQAQGATHAAHGMGTRSTQQPNGHAQWMTDQQAHSQQMQHAQQMRQQQQQQGYAQQGQQGYPPGQQGGYAPGQAQQQGYSHAQAQQAQQRQAAEHQAMFRAHQEEQHRNMTQQQPPQPQNDGSQVGKKQPLSVHGPSSLQPTEQPIKVAKMQQDTAQQYPQITQQPGAAQQAQQQDGTMSTAAPSLMTADSKMKVAQDAHREYRKAGEHVQTAHQLLRIVSGQTQQGSLSPQAIAHLTQAKWVEAVKKAIGDYQHTERTLQRAVKVLKTHQDRATKEQAMQQLHKVATHARALQDTLRQHIASAEAARARFSNGATQDPAAGTLLTPRSSNSMQGTTPPPFDTASAGQQQGQQGRILTPRQPAGSSHSGVTMAGANGMSAGFNADPATGAVPGADGGFPQGPASGTGAATQPSTQPKAKLRIRPRGASAAAAQAASQAAEANAAAARNDAGIMPGSGPTATQQGLQGTASGAFLASPRTTTPPNAPAAVGSEPAGTASASLPTDDPKAMHMRMYSDGSQMQHSHHMVTGAMTMGGAYGGQQGVGSPDTAPSGLSSGTPHRMMDHSMHMMGSGAQYGAGQYGAGGHAYATHAGGAGSNNAAAGPGGYSNTGVALPHHSMGGAAPSSGAGMAAAGGATAAAAAPYVIPSGGMTKAHCAPETDYSSSGNILRLSAVPDSTQKAMLSTSLNPVTHPVPPTSGIQSNSFDSDSTEVLSGPLRTPAPTTLSVCDLDLSVNDRYSAFSRTVDPCTPMIHLPGKAPCAASDTAARPAPPPMALPLPDTEAARRLISVCSTLTAEFGISLRPAKCNPVYSQQDQFTVAVRPLTVSNDGSNNGQGSTEDHSWCSIDVLINEAAWEAGQQECMIVWPQVQSAARDMQAQGHAAVMELAARELRSLMQSLLSKTGMAPSLQSIVDIWRKVQHHISQQLAVRLQQC